MKNGGKLAHDTGIVLSHAPPVKRRPRRWPLVPLALSLALLCTPSTAQRSVLPALGEDTSLTLAAERRLGDRIARELFRDPDYLEDPLLDEYVQKLWQPLLVAASARGDLPPDLRERFAWRLLLGRDRSVNAFALPGGYFGVHLGLIATVQTRDELASVLAHELSHVTQRHIARSIEAQGRMTPWVVGSMILGALAASKSPQATQALIVGGQAAMVQNQLGYSRDMEREADRVGFGVLSDAGYDPRGFVTMFSKLQQAAGINDNGAFPYLRSHPLTTDRIADMQSRLPLGTGMPKLFDDLEQALVSARARVLSQSQVDALRLWTRLPDALVADSPLSQRLAAHYAAALAHTGLRDWPAAERQLQTLQGLANTPTTRRLVRLLHAEFWAAQGQHLQALAHWQPSTVSAQWPRAELMGSAQALLHLPTHPSVAVVTEQLRRLVQLQPQDAQAWQALAALLLPQGLRVAALRAEGEAQWARLDAAGALDRFRAAQDMARRGGLQGGEHIEASIVDTRVRAMQEVLREQHQER